ncbi:hypothetical protein KAFR_0B04030 [Kazachstania africana CBS 2517]|uniref:Phosphoribulokinase/uridine kinase domain-containing protein n=1 Tax=Kazachstania africana (strain ATCC 22294 / BCRC 22015 / CBS 2517 / CECT 1963 / NBRC 1671 / NRRL Y-8276) TaxID=1071382 RepID=H2AQP9_KAZAF|nr:hypothetical protein KAFR_0B04030 [Kazachstania africana CBS 2517]CCF56699.1 hypothetical protein KAFR_0B04030 [Kazachstania africana CBS 2517]
MVDNKVIDYTFEFVDTYIPQWFETGTKGPLFIYVSGPQGSGKTFTSQKLYEHLVSQYGEEKNIALASIDDFYLTHEAQISLNSQYPNNKLLQGRGLPGTHDMSLLNSCLRSILQSESNGEDKDTVLLPRYDKSKFNGEGDRSEEVARVKLPVDIFILEGWFLGFNPILGNLGEEVETMVEGDMIDVNAKLFMYGDLMWKNPEIHSLGIVFDTDDINNVYEWRLEQEHRSIELNGSGMTNEKVKLFVDKYFPCYQLYYEALVRSENLGSIATLTLGIDLNRNTYSTKTRSIE